MRFKVFALSIIFLLRLCSGISNLYEYINDSYGEDGKKLLKNHENQHKKRTKAELDLSFLCKCKIYNIFPKFLQFKLYKKVLQSSSFYRKWQNKLLSREIHYKKKTISSLTTQIEQSEDIIIRTFTYIDYIVIKRHVRQNLSKFEKHTIDIHNRKLQQLGIHNNITPCDPDKTVFNYSKVNISHRIKTLLAYGLDFCLPVYKLDFYKYFLPIESIVSRIKFLNLHRDINFSEFINKFHAISHKYFYNFNAFKIFSSVFSKKDIDDIRTLASNKEIIICKPDKGRGVIILDKATYVSQMYKLLSDNTKFEKITNYSFAKYTLKIEDKINNMLRKLKRLNTISTDIYNKLFCTGTTPGILYGLPKIHKIDFSHKFQFRPIFAAYSTPAYNISKYLVSYLSPLANNEYTVDNSYTFVSHLSNVAYSDNLYMTSFDVSNLYTNIPLMETINIILDSLFTNVADTFIGMSRSLFKLFLEMCVTNSFFIFNGELFKQTDGLGMGLPLAPTFANIFMSYHEKKFLNNCPAEFSPVFYRRYVDDTFVLFRSKNHANLFYNYINNQHSNLSFTMEVEANGRLPFLDVTVTKSCNSFNTSVYRKPSNSNLTISFFSFCSFNFKLNSIKSLLSRAYGICSNYNLLHEEFQYIRNLFHMNGFGRQFIDKQIGNFLSKKFNSSCRAANDKQKLYFTLPYFGSQSDELRTEISKLMHSYFNNISFQLILCNPYKLGNFFTYKDKISKGMRSSLVYKYCCARCASEYVGSTSRALATRVAEHAGRSFRTNRVLTNPPNSNIYEHANNCDTPINLDNFSILNSCRNNSDLHVLESLYIYKLKPVLNSSQSAIPLHIVNK